jgi:hypothetical protein
MRHESILGIGHLQPKSEPVAPGHYFGWTCSECAHAIAVYDDHSRGRLDRRLFEAPRARRVRLRCPRCGADHFYDWNLRHSVHVGT